MPVTGAKILFVQTDRHDAQTSHFCCLDITECHGGKRLFLIFQVSAVQRKAAKPSVPAIRNTTAVTVTRVSSILWPLARLTLRVSTAIVSLLGF